MPNVEHSHVNQKSPKVFTVFKNRLLLQNNLKKRLQGQMMNNKESHDTGWCAWGKKKIEPRDTGVSDEIETPKTGLRLVKYSRYLRSIGTLRVLKALQTDQTAVGCTRPSPLQWVLVEPCWCDSLHTGQDQSHTCPGFNNRCQRENHVNHGHWDL